MTKEEKSEIKYRMKRLARKFCRRNDVYTDFDGVVGELVERAYLSAYLLCLHENKNKIAELEKENAQAKEILRLFLDANDNLEMVNAQMKAERFIKDVEVEK